MYVHIYTNTQIYNECIHKNENFLAKHKHKLIGVKHIQYNYYESHNEYAHTQKSTQNRTNTYFDSLHTQK